MKLILASFGLGTADDFGSSGHYTSSAYGHDHSGYPGNPFLRMPAVAMNRFGPKFVPDYAVFLLFDSFLIDRECYNLIHTSRGFEDLKALLSALESEGRVEIASFEEIIEPFKPMIDQSAEYDLRNLEMWTDAFEALFERWQNFRELVKQAFKGRSYQELLGHEYELLRAVESAHFGMIFTPDGLQIMDSIKNWKRSIPRKQRERTKLVARDYFRYVSSNLCLSQCTGGILHEWGDIEPLCLKKLALSANPSNKAHASQQSVRQLFDLMLPEFRPDDTKQFARAFNDRRLESLRSLVNGAVTKQKSFDQEFLNATLREVLASKDRSSFYRKLVGWMTMPLDLVPWAGTALQKVTEELVGKVIDKHFEKEHEWFFLVSDFGKLQSNNPTTSVPNQG